MSPEIEATLTGTFYPVDRVLDESLSSFLSRLCQENGFTLGLLAAETRAWTASSPLVIDLLEEPVLSNLGRVLGMAGSELREMTLNRLAPAITGRPSLSVPDRESFVVYSPPRVCPRCVQDGILRLSWRLSFVTVCPYHECMLVDRCHDGQHVLPSGENLWFGFPCGDELDEFIVAPSAPTRTAQSHIRALLGLAGGLRDARGLLPELNSAQYFRTLFTLQHYARRLPGSRLATRKTKGDVANENDELNRLHDVLACWPTPFLELMDQWRTYRGARGKFAHLERPLARLALAGVPQLRDAFLIYYAESSGGKMLRRAFPRELFESRRYLNRTNAARLLNIEYPRLDTWWGKELPVEVRDGREVVERGVLENFIRERDRWLTKRDAARRLQIDKKSIDRLVRLGLLRSEARRPRGLTEIWIDSQSIEELLALLSGQVRRGTQGIPLRRAAALLSSYMLLVDILAEIVAGRLRIFSQTKPLSGLRDIQVSHEGVIALLRKQSLQRGEQDGVAKWIAARLLGVKDAMIEHWASIGSLRRLPNGRFSLTDVLAFRRRYQPCATLARKMGLPHQRVMSWVKLGLVRAVPGPKLQRVGPCWVSWKDVSITRSLMTVTAVAAKLKVTTSRVEWWVQTGQLTPFRHDTLGRPYFRTQDVALAPRTRPDLPRAVAADSLAQQLDCTSETVLRMLDQLGVRRGRWSNKVARHGASTLFRSMSSEQAARLLRVSDVAIRKWARTGQLQAHTGPTIDGAQYYRFVAHVVLKFADQLRQVQKQRGKRAPRQLWTPEEAAEYLHTDKSTVERLVHARLLTTIDGGFKPGDVRRLNPLPDLIGVITAVEAAEMLGVDRSSLDGYSKRMPVVSKIGTAKLYRLTDVTAWAELRGSSLTPPVAAQFLDVSRATVRELRLAGKLVPVSGPHIDGIGVYRFLITDLERVRSEFRPSRRPRGRLFDEAAAA